MWTPTTRRQHSRADLLGVSPSASRRIPTVAGLLLAGAFMAASPFAPGTSSAIAMMSAALFCAYGAGSSGWALGAPLAPADVVATLEAIQNVGGSMGGALAPLIAGLIVERAGSYTLAFIVAAVVATISGASYAFVRAEACTQTGGGKRE